MLSPNSEKATPYVAVDLPVQHGEVTELIPGTELLVDLEYRLGKAHDRKNIVLIPSPSGNPDDPLNWSNSRKWVAMSIVCFWAFMLGAATLSPSITYSALIPLFGVDVTFLNIGAAVALFNLGFFNIFFSPLVRADLSKSGCSFALTWLTFAPV